MGEPMLPRHLVLFARRPQLGAVKRRLATDIGAAAAYGFYRRTLRDVAWRLGRDPRWRTWLAVTPDSDAGATGLWEVPPGTAIIGQGAGDLGARMARPLREFPPGPVVIVGSDIPEVEVADIADAFRALGNNDLVFGPAADGGYWLVGARRRPVAPRNLFADVRWSSEHALADTLANVPPKCRVTMVSEHSDVDDGAAWRRWRIRRLAAKITRHR
jgi:rSAM/selenodomain-associated transferase 1